MVPTVSGRWEDQVCDCCSSEQFCYNVAAPPGGQREMTPDVDIHRAAWPMIRCYGEDAAVQAAMRGDELLARGDLDGMLLWLAIAAE